MGVEEVPSGFVYQLVGELTAEIHWLRTQQRLLQEHLEKARGAAEKNGEAAEPVAPEQV
jgi:hypothetical protein